MPALKPLDPTIKVILPPLEAIETEDGEHPLELVVLEAGRSDKGIRARIDAVNGRVKSSGLVAFAVSEDRRRFTSEVQAATSRPAADVETALLALGQHVDVALRELEAESEAEEGSSESVALLLIQYAQAATLFVNDRDEAYARFPVDRHWETWPLRSQTFKFWLTRRLYQDTNRAASSEDLQKALNVLEGKARFDGAGKRALSIRVAEEDGCNWLDFANPEWSAVQITPTGWQIVPEPPCLFRRYAPVAPQLEPQNGGSIETLRRFLNLREDPADTAWVLLVAWLVAAFLPNVAHPVLVVHGEQGSAKSTLLRLVGLLIDPSHTPLRSQPRDLGEWCQVADHCWLVCLDNLSSLPVWLSDALCRAVYQEGFQKRKLYTDEEDILMSFRRVIALSGIEVVATRPDLLDRSLLLALEPIAPQNRRLESEVLAEFDQERPQLLGALLYLVCAVLRELPSVKLDELPRMADFARIGVAVERAMGWKAGDFIKAYRANVETQHEEAISSSPVGDAVLKFMETRCEWSGTPTDLLTKLGETFGENKTRPQEWPKAPKSLSGILKRLAPNLRAVGVSVTFSRSGRSRSIHLKQGEKPPGEGGGKAASFASQASSSSHSGDASPSVGDAHSTVSDANGEAVTHPDLDDANDANLQTLRGQVTEAWNRAGLEKSADLLHRLLGRVVSVDDAAEDELCRLLHYAATGTMQR